MAIGEISLRSFFAAAAVAAGLVPAVSCVNETYDLNNGIDMTVGIDGNISLPVGSTADIPVCDFLDIDKESVLKADPVTGDYSVSIASDAPISENITIGRINIGPEDLMSDGGVEMDMNVYMRLKNILGQSTPDDLDVSSMQLTDVKAFEEQEITVPVDMDEDLGQLADVVKAIGTVRIDAPSSLVFSISEGAVTFNSGFSIDFPECMEISLDKGETKAEVIDGHTIRFLEDFTIAKAKDVTLPMYINAIDVKKLQQMTGGSQGLVDGRLFVDQDIALRELYFDVKVSDFGKVLGDMPQAVMINIDMDVLSVEVVSATGVIDPDIELENQRFEVGQLPDFLSGEETVLDLYNPVVVLDVENTSPFQALVSAQLCGLDAAGSVISGPIELGSGDRSSQDAILIGSGRTMIYISARGADISGAGSQPQGYNPPLDIIVENLPELLRSVPSSLELSGIRLVIPHEGNQAEGYADSDYVEIEYPEGDGSIVYDFSIGYQINLPLSFGEDFRISYPFDIAGIGGSLENSGDAEGTTDGKRWDMEIRNLEIDFTFVNAIPLDMAIAAVPIDAEGNEIPESPEFAVSIASADGTPAAAKAGNIGSESASRLKITGHADKASVNRLDGFRLEVSAATPSGFAGVCLNAGQYVRIEDMSASIEGSGSIDLGKVELAPTE